MLATDPNIPVTPVRQFFSHRKTSARPDECEYCIKKQKISNNDPNVRCLLHSLERNKSSEFSNSGSRESNIIEEALELLNDVEEILEQYWSHLHEYSNGSPEKVKVEIMPVFNAVQRIEQKLAKFPFGQIVHTPIRHETRHSLVDEDRKQTRSEKFLPSNFSELFEDTTVNDQIREWVMYFSKILVNREIREELLPFDDEVDMRIFKESMSRKFQAFAKNYEKYEKRLSMALQKLLFYMQACGDRVSEKVLQADIAFMEASAVPKHKEVESEKRMLMVQALVIEDLLARSQ